MTFQLTFRIADVPEPAPKEYPIAVLAPVKECAAGLPYSIAPAANGNLLVGDETITLC